MTISPARTRPLIAVLSRVPLFVEAMRAAFDGIADVQPVSADDLGASGLVRAFHPTAVIVEGIELDGLDLDVPCLRVEIGPGRVSIVSAGVWRPLDIELSPEAIRNAVVEALYRGEPA